MKLLGGDTLVLRYLPDPPIKLMLQLMVAFWAHAVLAFDAMTHPPLDILVADVVVAANLLYGFSRKNG